MKISKDTVFEEILSTYPEAIPVLAKHGFHGVACPAEMWASLRVISESRGIMLDPLLDDLNKVCID
jgi:hypothetical protein